MHVVARSEATKQSPVFDDKNEIASFPSVTRNDMVSVTPPRFRRGEAGVARSLCGRIETTGFGYSAWSRYARELHTGYSTTFHVWTSFRPPQEIFP